jgi:dynamin 1-like protein
MYYIFNDVFGHALGSIEPMQLLEIQNIHTAIHNSTGPHRGLFE